MCAYTHIGWFCILHMEKLAKETQQKWDKAKFVSADRSNIEAEGMHA